MNMALRGPADDIGYCMSNAMNRGGDAASRWTGKVRPRYCPRSNTTPPATSRKGCSRKHHAYARM